MAKPSLMICDEEDVTNLRQMLLIGQLAIGEIERLRDLNDLNKADGNPLPDNLLPIHPTGASEMKNFARALMMLEYA